MIDQTVLRRLVSRLQSSEQRLLSAQNLHGGGWELGEIEQRTGVSDETRSDQFADHDGEIGSDGVHAILQVFEELDTISSEIQDLCSEFLDVLEIAIADIRSGRDQRGSLELFFDF